MIALSGILDVDPQRPLAFSLVTNGDTPLSARFIRRAHEQLVGLLVRYLTKTRKAAPVAPVAPPTPPVNASPVPPNPPEGEANRSELEELEPDPALDDEAAGQH